MSSGDRGSQRGPIRPGHGQQDPNKPSESHQQSMEQQRQEERRNNPNKQQQQRDWEDSQIEHQREAHRPTEDDDNLKQESENQRNQDPTRKVRNEEE